jgi:hypothetical protein
MGKDPKNKAGSNKTSASNCGDGKNSSSSQSGCSQSSGSNCGK